MCVKKCLGRDISRDSVPQDDQSHSKVGGRYRMSSTPPQPPAPPHSHPCQCEWVRMQGSSRMMWCSSLCSQFSCGQYFLIITPSTNNPHCVCVTSCSSPLLLGHSVWSTDPLYLFLLKCHAVRLWWGQNGPNQAFLGREATPTAVLQ